jgi:hypothetical protein
MTARAGEHRYFLAAALVLTFLVLWAFSFEYRDLLHPTSITTLRNLVLLAFIVIDTMRTRRLHPALAGGSAFLLAADAGANMLAGTAAWAGIVRTLTA